MGREDYRWVQGGKLRPKMLVLDIGGNARNGSVPEGVGVVEEITNITAASPSRGKEYVKLHLKEVKRGKERTRFACKTKLFKAYQGEGIPTELMLAPDRSEAVALSSLEVDDVVHGDVEDVIPDSEGRKRIVQHVSYERSRKDRAMAIKIHGTRCQACGFDFDEFYGREHAGSYIEVHHVKPLSEHEGEVDPARDLVCVCANCHRMAHRTMTSVTSVEELRVMIEEASS